MSFLNNIIWSPSAYSQASVLAQEAGEEMISRLGWMTLKPQVIVDMGCGTGEMSERLQACYPGARFIATDCSASMIEQAKRNRPDSDCLCADAGRLPLADQSVDLIFANFLLPWHQDWASLLREWRRLLRPRGLLMVTALGPDTLKAWQTVWKQDEMPLLVDMHDLGDLLLRERFADPVVDATDYTLIYQDLSRLVQELKASGMLGMKSGYPNSRVVAPNKAGKWTTTFEVVFAHAFAPETGNEVSASADGTARIPLSHLRRHLRGG